MLFSSLYRSWCHNPVAVFALCLLAQAYEHASNLLQILYVAMPHLCRGALLGSLVADRTSADLELTVSLLVQMDKLVMLIESPVFLSTFVPLFLPRSNGSH